VAPEESRRMLDCAQTGGQRMNRTVAAVLVVLALAGAALAKDAGQEAHHAPSARENAQPAGRLVGTVTAIHGDRLPGVEVTVTKAGAATKRTTVAGGGFAFDALPPGDYEFTARLAGFRMCAPKAPVVQVATGRITSLKILMVVELSEEVRVVFSTVQSLLGGGGPVVRLRVSGRPRIIPETCDLLTAYRGTVVEVLKQPTRGGPIGSEVRFVEESCSRCRPPFARGDDMVAILHRIEDHYSVSFCWSIKNGRVVAADDLPVMQRFVGMPAADFIKELRGLIAESGRHWFRRAAPCLSPQACQP
jgi:hypothetical protein